MSLWTLNFRLREGKQPQECEGEPLSSHSSLGFTLSHSTHTHTPPHIAKLLLISKLVRKCDTIWSGIKQQIPFSLDRPYFSTYRNFSAINAFKLFVLGSTKATQYGQIQWFLNCGKTKWWEGRGFCQTPNLKTYMHNIIYDNSRNKRPRLK